MAVEPKLLQIIPAEGWSAVYARRGADEGITLYELPLVSWALASKRYRSGGISRDLIGLVVDPELLANTAIACEATAPEEPFVGYKPVSEDLANWQGEGERVVEREERLEASEDYLRQAGFEYAPDNYGSMWLDPYTRRAVTLHTGLRLLRERAA